MGYDLKLIKQILEKASQSNILQINTEEMFQMIKNAHPELSENEKDQLAYSYMSAISELNLFACNSKNLGLQKSLNGSIGLAVMNVPLTIEGQELIEKLNNETIWKKCVKKGGKVGIETFRILAQSSFSKILNQFWF